MDLLLRGFGPSTLNTLSRDSKAYVTTSCFYMDAFAGLGFRVLSLGFRVFAGVSFLRG